MRSRISLLRDLLVVLATAGATVPHAIGGRWALFASGLLCGAAWVVSARRSLLEGSTPRWWHRAMASGRVSQVSFLLIGVLAVWRFRSSFLPLAVTTVWLLVAAADLEQLCKRYPAEASPLRQRVFVRRRLKNLVVVGLVSAAVVPVAGWMSVELRLVAVIVLAAVFAGQLLRGLRLASAGGFAGDDDDV